MHFVSCWLAKVLAEVLDVDRNVSINVAEQQHAWV